MFRKIEDFLGAFEYQSNGTLNILSALTDESLSQAVMEGHRTLGRMAWHIVQTFREMMERTGLKIDGPSMDALVPMSASEIQDAYKTTSESFVNALKDNWTDETLLETDDMYGETWQRGLTVSALLAHETHHRGQMTVLMRQAGLVVPGVYGPAKEGWAEHGAEAPAI